MDSTKSAPSMLPFKSTKNVFFTTPKKHHHHQPPLSVDPAVATPDRANPPPRTRNAVDKSSALLPEKYEMLCEFFNAMVSSIRLLRLKRLPATLTKLSRTIESLTDRRFTLHHLAQLKHLVPEVIAIKKIRVQDEDSNCMKEELLISLDAEAVEIDENRRGSGAYSHLKGIFRSRIIDYASSHPEGENVPEGDVPYQFYQPKQDHEHSMNGTRVPLAASLTSPLFKRRFSSRAPSDPVPEFSSAKPSPCLPETPLKEATSSMAIEGCSSTVTDSDATPAKVASTPMELISTPARLMTATPALSTPKRALMTEGGISDSLNKSAKRSRALKFEDRIGDVKDQLSENENDPHLRGSAALKDALEVVPDNFIHASMVSDQMILEEQDLVSQERRRQQLMSQVPKLLDMIDLSFQSTRRSVMTKEELIYKLITEEVEEQITLLQEVAPGFISEQICSSGDTLLRLNKFSCAESIRANMLEAK